MDLSEDLPFKILRRTWQPVALSRDLPPNSVCSYRLLDQEIVIARLPAGLLAASNACPHKGMRLEKGSVIGDELQCAYHGWRFDQAGRCAAIPSLIDPTPEKRKLASLATFDTRERYGMIWVKLDAGPERAPLPDVAEFENPRWTYLVADPMPFAAGFRREIENYLDMTHFAFAHSSTLGLAASKVIDPPQIKTFDGGFEMHAPFPALASPGAAPGKLQQAHRRHQRCHLPNFTTIRQSFADGDERVLLHVPSPNTHDTCTVFWSLAVSPGFSGPAPRDQLSFAISVLEEDRSMCENQIPREVPINPASGGWGVLVTPGDTLANTFQKAFRRFISTEEGSYASSSSVA